jgi:hypothetical protein
MNNNPKIWAMAFLKTPSSITTESTSFFYGGVPPRKIGRSIGLGIFRTPRLKFLNSLFKS